MNSRTARLEIAGVNFSISLDPAIELRESDPAYQSFWGKKSTGGDALDIKIRLRGGEFPDIKSAMQVFVTGQSWSQYRDGGRHWICLHPPQHARPLWVAMFDRRLREVVVYLGPDIPAARSVRFVLDNPVRYPLDQLLLMYFLARHQGVLVHAAGLCMDGKGIIFPGQSGAGKSTLARQFQGKGKWRRLSDERVVIRKTSSGWRCFGTPWHGTEAVAANEGASLRGIFFLKQGEDDLLERIAAAESLERFLPVCSIPWYDQEMVERIIPFCKTVLGRVPAYELAFRPGDKVSDLLEKFLSE